MIVCYLEFFDYLLIDTKKEVKSNLFKEMNENGFARFPFRYKSVNLKMSEDETKDYLMVHSCYDS